MLTISRDEVESYLDARGLPRVVDPTNTSDRFVRNRVRLEVMAPLRKIAGEAGLHAAYRSALTLREDAHALGLFVEEIVERGVLSEEPAWYFPSGELSELGRAIAGQVLRHAARRVAPNHVVGQRGERGAVVHDRWHSRGQKLQRSGTEFASRRRSAQGNSHVGRGHQLLEEIGWLVPQDPHLRAESQFTSSSRDRGSG